MTMSYVMTAMTLPFRVYSCHLCNKMMLLLSFFTSESPAPDKQHLHTRAFLGWKVNMHQVLYYDRGRKISHDCDFN